MHYFKIIRTDQEHEQALAHLMALMDMDPAPETSEADELDVLALLIERYEQEQFPIDLPEPIEAIKFRMDQAELVQRDLIPYLGSASKVSEVLNGKRSLSLNMIRSLSEGLGISADVLIREPIQLKANDKDIDWQAFPLAEMRKRGYFPAFTGSLRDLKEYAAEKIGGFLSTVPSGFSLQPAMLRTSAHLRSNDKETDTYALWAWQVKVLQLAQEDKLEIRYQPGTVDLNFMRKLAQESWSDKGPLIAKEYLNKYGIHLIVEPHLPKTYLDGAVCKTADGRPVIAMTLRHDKLDNFWFTLMHELAHIALHLDGTESWFIDDLDASGVDILEQEADALAQEALLPVDALSRENLGDSSVVAEVAKEFHLNPCILAGRLRHETSNHRLFGMLFREKIRHIFE
ncbi:MAG: ImmA/IrrE family metallo-endopeptidase [Motiliproteus sp.]